MTPWTEAEDIRQQRDDANHAARGEVASQRAQDHHLIWDERLTRADCEPNELLDETNRCSVCEYGHHGHVCRWCIAAGRTP